MKGWQYRWFVLDYNAGLLSYYTEFSLSWNKGVSVGKNSTDPPITAAPGDSLTNEMYPIGFTSAMLAC
ncbi:hypothetical protein WMY93_025342 [Mugilogobius chulae]|uniref:PH domain-containing protein n=1 Tax=Mugilogobius chulae TaxID=88201 RepID=A0AAW0ND74_9GOBI